MQFVKKQYSLQLPPPPPSLALNFAEYENSVASTPCNSILSTDHSFSSDWPDPPENPICSTEDEAGSIITDSGNALTKKKLEKLKPHKQKQAILYVSTEIYVCIKY